MSINTTMQVIIIALSGWTLLQTHLNTVAIEVLKTEVNTVKTAVLK